MSDNAIQKTAQESAFELAQREARALAASSLLPDHFRDNLPNIMIAMDAAKRLNAAPLQVMQSIYIVHGKPAYSSSFLIATVNASGKFTPLRFQYEGEVGQPERGCRAVARDKSTGDECLGPLVTMAMARAEGWIDKKGSKWQTMPELMLAYRAAAFWTRLYSPETTMGVYTTEEIRDVGHHIDATVISAEDAKPPLEQLKDKLREKPAADDDPDAPIPYTPTVDSETGEVKGFDPVEELRLAAIDLWGDNVFEAELVNLCAVHGYDVTDLTDAQASTLLDVLATREERR